MGRFIEALRQQAETHDAEIGATIRNLAEKELIDWCKKSIGGHKDLLSRTKINIEALIDRSATPEDQAAVLELVLANHLWRDALIEVAKARRQSKGTIPGPWGWYLLDYFLGVEKRPNGKGRKSESNRDEAIEYCIRQIVKHTTIKATRSEASGEKTCAVSIVADALGSTGYEGVERVWSNRAK